MGLSNDGGTRTTINTSPGHSPSGARRTQGHYGGALALEWPGDFTPVIRAFLASGTLADHWWLWGGDGRVTAGHLAVLGTAMRLVPP